VGFKSIAQSAFRGVELGYTEHRIKSNAPENYECPICLGVQGIESEATLMKSTDVAYKDELVTAFINSFFVGKNVGHVIIVPNEHFENIYTLPAEYGHKISTSLKKLPLL
jgi:histidine triad (HIT) family protein